MSSQNVCYDNKPSNHLLISLAVLHNQYVRRCVHGREWEELNFNGVCLQGFFDIISRIYTLCFVYLSLCYSGM